MRCRKKTEVFSRVVGFHRPIREWNEGKRSEFQDRKNFNLTDKGRGMSSIELGKDLLEKAKRREKIEGELKDINKELTALSTQLYEQMDREGSERFDLEGISFVKHIERDFKRIDQGRWDDPRFFAWLKEIGEAGLIKTRESVHAQTRKAFLKDYVGEKDENGIPLHTLPAWIQETYFNTVKFSRTAIKRMVNGE